MVLMSAPQVDIGPPCGKLCTGAGSGLVALCWSNMIQHDCHMEKWGLCLAHGPCHQLTVTASYCVRRLLCFRGVVVFGSSLHFPTSLLGALDLPMQDADNLIVRIPHDGLTLFFEAFGIWSAAFWWIEKRVSVFERVGTVRLRPAHPMERSKKRSVGDVKLNISREDVCAVCTMSVSD